MAPSKGGKSVDRTLAAAKRLAKSGDLPAARAMLDDLVARYPHNRRARDEREALERLARPPEVRSALSRAAELYKARRWADTARVVHPLADRHPDDAMIQRLFAGALLKLNQFKAAAVPLERLIQIDGEDTWALVNTAIVLNHHERTDQAIAILRAVIAQEPDNAKAHNNLGNALRTLGRVEEAHVHLERAVALDPHSAEGFNNYGVALAERGDREGARAAQARAIALAPDYVSAHRNYASVHRYTADDPHRKEMEALLPRIPSSSPNRAMLHFALGKAYDDIDATTDAFHHYAAGNRLRSKELGFSIDDEEARFRRIALASATGEARDVPDGSPRPIFIVGMPRSGTSLVEQILSAHPTVAGLGEVSYLRDAVDTHWPDQDPPVLTDPQLDAIAGDYRDAAEADMATIQPNATAYTDKAPLNFRWAGLLQRAMPDAVIINVMRQPEAACWSIFKLYFSNRGHGYGYDLADVGGMYRLYDALMAVWRDRFPGAVFDLSYEALTENPEAEITALLAHCELPFHEACLSPHRATRAVQTASALQVKKAIYTGSSEDWQRYETHLDPLKRALVAPKPQLLPRRAQSDPRAAA